MAAVQLPPSRGKRAAHDDRSQTHVDDQTHLRRNRLWLAGGGVVAVAALIAGFWLLDSGQGNAVARPEKVTR